MNRVLVATDCLSEGVNLQSDFQAVVHYDLAWNPTRHEQREGRVDRFGQTRDIVRAQTIYGSDNGIDGIVLDVLIRKHEKIRRDLGISVPVPAQSDEVLSALLEGAVMRGNGYEQLAFDFGLDDGGLKDFDAEWESSAEKEKQSQTMFAQRTIHPDEVKEAMDAARRSLGEPGDVSGFVADALTELGALLTATPTGFTTDLSQVPVQVTEALAAADGRPVTTYYNDLPAPRHAAVLQRTDPTVTALANYVLNSALDGSLAPKERRRSAPGSSLRAMLRSRRSRC